MHPEQKDILMAIGHRDVDLLNASRGSLILRSLHIDLDEEAELRDLFQGSCGTTDPIDAVIVLPPPSDGEPPVRVPLSATEALKWCLICDVYQQVVEC